MASPADSLASLSLNASDSQGLIAARLRKESALRDMQRSMELQAGDPRHTFSGATNADIADEQSSLAESPNFGTQAQKDVAGVQALNTEGSNYNRPDVTQRRQEDIATKKMLALAPIEATGKNALALEAQKAKNEAAQRDQTFKNYVGIGSDAGLPAGTQKTIDINASGEPTMHLAPPPKPGQLEQRTISMIHEGTPIINRLDELLGNPSRDPLSQLLSKGRNTASQFAFDHGLGTPDQAKQDLEGLLAVLGSSAYVVGSRSYQLIQKAMAHLTTGSGSDAFNKQQIATIRNLWPQMLAEVQQAHTNPMGPVANIAGPASAVHDPAGIR